jgi:hypothetical protein
MSESRKSPAPPPPRRPGTDDASERNEREIPESREAGRKRERIQRQLDDALAATFPASDPVAIVTSHREEDDEEA